MKRVFVWIGGVVLAGLAAWQGAMALQENPEAPASVAAPEETSNSTAETAPRQPVPPLPGNRAATPMPERVATLGVLNKRNGLSRDLVMKPGDAVRMGDLVVRLRACEETAPWEPEKWTGAFVQVITRHSGTRWRKNFSGWLYKESPSLNVVEHPIYDVWVKACKMRHPDVGPDTILARGGDSGGASSASSAPKSVEPSPAADTPDSAAPSITE